MNRLEIQPFGTTARTKTPRSRCFGNVHAFAIESRRSKQQRALHLGGEHRADNIHRTRSRESPDYLTLSRPHSRLTSLRRRWPGRRRRSRGRREVKELASKEYQLMMRRVKEHRFPALQKPIGLRRDQRGFPTARCVPDARARSRTSWLSQMSCCAA